MLWVVLVVIVAAVGLLIAYQKGVLTPGAAQDDAALGQADPTATVATVNGVVITRDELDKKMKQIQSSIPDGVTDPGTDPMFESQVLDEIINFKILLGQANTRGIEVTMEEIDAEIKTLVELFGSQEAFDLQLTAAGLTLQTLRTNMQNELMIRKLVNAETNLEEVAVTDDELKAAFSLAYPEGTEGAPAYEEVAEMLRAQLIQQKGSAIVEAYVGDLRNESTVETFL